MSNTVIVVVTDLDNSAHGEINVLGSQEEAAQLVETLIESGYDQARVRAFAADEFEIRVHHRPVVALTSATEADETGQAKKVAASEGADQKKAAQTLNAESAVPPVMAEAASEPYSRDGVRFSSQFSPAYLTT
ncbi:MAG TPA: hypothetical protein VIW01_13375 [Dehalococcoidia bacterium]